MKRNKILLILACVAVLGLALLAYFRPEALSGTEQPLPATYEKAMQLRDYRNCSFDVEISGDVLLSHVIEVHPNSNAFPDAYSAVDKDLHYIVDTLSTTRDEPIEKLLGRVQSPYPDEFFIGKWLKYKVRVIKQECVPVPPTRPRPKEIEQTDEQ